MIKELIKKLLREALTPTTNLYYSGSRRKEIQWGSAPEYHGHSIFGYGMYLTTNKYEAIEYALNKGNEVGYLHQVTLENDRFVDIKDKVSPDIITKVKNIPNIYSIFKTKSGELKSFNYWDVYGDEDGDYPHIDFTKQNIFESYDNLYFYLALFLKSLKKTSQFFALELGIDGFITKSVGVDDVELDSDDYILTLLNANIIRKVNTKEVTEKDKQINSYNDFKY
jgi:hypothetical protein